jgi:hypothetical protein
LSRWKRSINPPNQRADKPKTNNQFNNNTGSETAPAGGRFKRGSVQQRCIFVPKNIFAACCGAYRGSELTPFRSLKYLVYAKKKSSKPGSFINLFHKDESNHDRMEQVEKSNG